MSEIDPERYYSDRFVQTKIAYHCRYREVIIIKHLEDKDVTLRPLKIFKPEHFRWLYGTRYHMQNIPFDIYISNASVKLPKLPPNTSVETRDMLSKTWNSIMTGYDYFVDIDASSPDDESTIISWAKRIRSELQKQGQEDTYPIEVWKTGSGGVHIIHKGMFDPSFVKESIMNIACKYDLPLRIPVKNIDGKRYIPENGKWCELKNDEQAPVNVKPFVDNGIYDYRRIRRVPHSLHSKHNKPMTRII